MKPKKDIHQSLTHEPQVFLVQLGCLMNSTIRSSERNSQEEVKLNLTANGIQYTMAIWRNGRLVVVNDIHL